MPKQYIAWDGTKFNLKRDYTEYMIMVKEITKIFQTLKECPKDRIKDFKNHMYFIQQDKKAVDAARKRYIELFNERYDYHITKWDNSATCRSISAFYGTQYKCLREFYIKLYYIDDQYREWHEDNIRHYSRTDAIQGRIARINKAKKLKRKTKIKKEG